MNTTNDCPTEDIESSANAESEAATQELLAIPGLLERVRHNQATPKTQYTSWKTLRSDV